MSKKRTEYTDEDLRDALKQYEQVFDKINRFTGTIRDQENDIEAAMKDLAKAELEFHNAKSKVAQLKSYRDGAKHSLYAFLAPGIKEILPLFDRMLPADESKHGANAKKWRQEPLATIRLSLPSIQVLKAADIVLVGQLQDLVQAKPNDWWRKIQGLTEPVAAAIIDRLNEFIYEQERK